VQGFGSALGGQMDAGINEWLRKQRKPGVEIREKMADEIEKIIIASNGDHTQCTHCNGFERVTYEQIGCKDCGFRATDEVTRLPWTNLYKDYKEMGTEIYGEIECLCHGSHTGE